MKGFFVVFKSGPVQGWFRFPCTTDQGGHPERSAHLRGQLQGSRGAQALEWLWQPQASIFSHPHTDPCFYILLHIALCCFSFGSGQTLLYWAVHGSLPACSQLVQEARIYLVGMHHFAVTPCMLLECFLACAPGQPGIILGISLD